MGVSNEKEGLAISKKVMEEVVIKTFEEVSETRMEKIIESVNQPNNQKMRVLMREILINKKMQRKIKKRVGVTMIMKKMKNLSKIA